MKYLDYPEQQKQFQPAVTEPLSRPARARARRYQSLILSSIAPLMAEVAHVGEEHRNTVLVGGGNHFVITDGTARLDYTGHARSGGGINTVAEREERVRSH